MSGAFLPGDMDELDESTCNRVRELGFSGIFTRFAANDPFETGANRTRRVRELLEATGVRMYQSTGYWQCLIHPDESERRQAVRTLREALRVAGELGSRGIDTGPGSLSPHGPWAPHPGNWSSESRAQLVKSLRESASAAEEHGVYLSLEGHQFVTLDSAETTRGILSEVDSPWVRSDFDTANWITLQTLFESGPAIVRMLDTLGDFVVSAHAKDLALGNGLHLHMDGLGAGQGLLDFDPFLQRMEALGCEYPVIVEGAGTEDLPAVSSFLHERARALGIELIGA